MWTIRARLALWYGGTLLGLGALLLLVTFLLLRDAVPPQNDALRDAVAERVGVRRPAPLPPRTPAERRADRLAAQRDDRAQTPGQAPAAAQRPLASGDDFDAIVDETRRELQEATVRSALGRTALVLAVGGVATAAAGWWLAGRMLRPVSEISRTVRRIAGGRMDQRVALGGPRDELRELGDQFDEMLDRLEASFRSQREFVANASHELRTPLAVMRTELDVTLADPDATVEDLRAAAAVVRDAIDRADALIAALLTLARAEGGRAGDAPVDLGVVAAEVLEQRSRFLGECQVTLRVETAPARCTGDRVLLGRMLDNLVANGALYNRPGGMLEVLTADRGTHVVVRVTNDGPPVAAAEAERLFERFTRLDSGRDRASGGAGLGLAIVRAVAERHGGVAGARARPEGGLEVTVVIPTGGARTGAPPPVD